MDIVIIGTGNVATILGRKMLLAGHRILQVFGRHPGRTAGLAERLGADPVHAVGDLSARADLILLALSDSSYASVAGSMPHTRSLVVHTAGAVSLQVLKGCGDRYGVLYPLQSLSCELDEIPDFPLLIDGNGEESLQILQSLAAGLSKIVVRADDDTRLRYHLGGVLVNNFTNHLYALTAAWCEKEGIAFSLLQPLITETAVRLARVLPAAVQTGPAIRHDAVSLEKHRRLLEGSPGLSALYEALTKSIQQFHHKK
jgi:predicted short-subunit dehydrogenase-like oxidoreductase (DUF2520 family)